MDSKDREKLLGPRCWKGAHVHGLSQGTPRGSHGGSEKDPSVALAGEGEDESF